MGTKKAKEPLHFRGSFTLIVLFGLLRSVRLSPYKITKILRYYFSGVPQLDIAGKLAVDQSTVSLYSSRFKERAAVVGLLSAGKEFGVLKEVEELRSLSVELSKGNLTTQDAKEGLKIIKSFAKLGVGLEKHTMLVKVCGKIDQSEFIAAALKLISTEDEAGIRYEEAILRFEQVTRQLPIAEMRLKEVKSNLKSLDSLTDRRKEELASLKAQLVNYQSEMEVKRASLEVTFESRLAELQREAKAQQVKLNQEFENKLKQLKVKQEEVEEVAKLKTNLQKQGMDIQTLTKVAKEFSYDSKKG